jgi:nitrite reductase (NADH) large subunit
MTPMREKLVIVGNGMASTRLVEELCSRAPGRYDITVIGAEPHAAYNRVLLSPLLAGDMCEADLVLKDEAWWQLHDIDTRVGCRVRSVNPASHHICLDDGDTLAYDRLVLATGSHAIRLPKPGMDLPGVITFRDLADARALLANATPGRPVVVIGGGLLGLEAAYGLARAGANVTLVHLMDRLMERQLDPRAGAMLKRRMEEKGMQILLQSDTGRILGTTHAEALELTDGRIVPAQTIVCAVGVRPNTDLARAAGLACQRGVLVDDLMMTSDPHVFAIGECAEHRGIAYGLVEPAYSQASILARHLGGESDIGYEGSVLSTNLKVSGVGLFSAGDFSGRTGSEVQTYLDEAAGIYKKLVFEDDRLTGALLFGDHGDALFYLDLIKTGGSVAHLRDDLVFGPSIALSEAA